MPFWTCFPCLKFNNDESVTTLDYSNGTLTDVPPNVSQFERTLEELHLSSNRVCICYSLLSTTSSVYCPSYII